MPPKIGLKRSPGPASADREFQEKDDRISTSVAWPSGSPNHTVIEDEIGSLLSSAARTRELAASAHRDLEVGSRMSTIGCREHSAEVGQVL